jgi:hypothetical protein
MALVPDGADAGQRWPSRSAGPAPRVRPLRPTSRPAPKRTGQSRAQFHGNTRLPRTEVSVSRIPVDWPVSRVRRLPLSSGDDSFRLHATRGRTSLLAGGRIPTDQRSLDPPCHLTCIRRPTGAEPCGGPRTAARASVWSTGAGRSPGRRGGHRPRSHLVRSPRFPSSRPPHPVPSLREPLGSPRRIPEVH